jgi:putative phosphoesterase
MKVGVLSDIHSNVFALQEVINELNRNSIDRLIVLGDIFGYYPWAYQTYQLLASYLPNAICIKGNHDESLLQTEPPEPVPSYWVAAKLNRLELLQKDHFVMDWLSSLTFTKKIQMANKNLILSHGTPLDPENGRYYPDDKNTYDWFPGSNEILMFGHTHYPVYKRLYNGGILINPGSVGQPRDGNPDASWGIFDTENKKFQFMRSAYDFRMVMSLLEEMNWDKRAIASLAKNEGGALQI